MWFMCNERSDNIFYSTTTNEVHTFKNKNKIKPLKDIFVYHFLFLYLFICSCKPVIIETQAYDIVHDENVMSSLIIQSI